MLKYLHGKSIDFTIPFVDSNGDAVSVTSVTWALYDEMEQQLAGNTVTTPSGDSLTVTISPEFNQITSGDVREARMLAAELVTDTGEEIVQKIYYLLEKEATLVVGENSFITYMQALRLVPSLATLKAWGAATQEEQKTALTAAYANIGNLSLCPGAAGQAVDSRHYAFNGTAPTTPRDLELADWELLSADFKRDFGLAQLVEADFLLGGDGVEQLRAQGVMSYTVGEVKQFYRTSTPLELGVTKDALRYIGKYISYNVRIGRA